MPIETAELRPVGRGATKIVAVFSYRYDAQLVPDLIANIAPSVHAWVAWDDRAATDVMSNEPLRRQALLDAARGIGAGWILAVDPDERFETALKDRIPEMARPGAPALWNFAVRELFDPGAYRIDGLWGGKKQMRLFPANASPAASEDGLHGGWVKLHSGLRSFDSGLNLYHLRHILPDRRQHRRDTYAAADPDRQFQKIGYDYLVDDRSMELEPIARGRGYLPAFVDDGALWGPPIEGIGLPKADNQGHRLRYVSVIRHRRGARGARYVLGDLMAKDHSDLDLPLILAQMSHEAGDHGAVEAEVAQLLKDRPAQALLYMIRAKSRLGSGDRAGARHDAVAAGRIAPELKSIQQFIRGLSDDPDRLTTGSALWRRWVTGDAQIFDGADVAQSDMAVVVLAYQAPPELRTAVQSLLDQSIVPEIIVVNSGGGDIGNVLGGKSDKVRVIDIADRLFVGAARNIGIDASNAPYVAFLAADCQATTGWVSGRLAAHAAGAAAVSSLVTPDRNDSLISLAAHAILHRRRSPTTPADKQIHYGLSYHRSVFADFGYFAPALRVGEDTDFNEQIAERIVVSMASGVTSTHHYPTGIWALCRDMFHRGRRRATHSPYSELRETPDAWGRVGQLSVRRYAAAIQSIQLSTRGGMLRFAYIRMLVGVAIIADTIGVAMTVRQMRQAAALVAAARTMITQDYDKAVEMLHRAIKLDSQSWSVFMALGEALLAAPAGTADKTGVWALKHAHALAPRVPISIATLCNALTKHGRVQEALDIADEAAGNAPAVWQYWSKACALALRLGQKSAATYFAQGALVQCPAGVAAHKSLAAVHKANKNMTQYRRRQASCDALEGKSE